MNLKIYLDVIFLINLFFDFLLLFTTKKILKKQTRKYGIFLGSIIGALSIFLLFININNLELFILKIIISIIMILVSFRFINIKDFITTTLTLYIVSIFLGGFMYFLNMNFSYKQEGLIFYHNSYSINIIMIIILTPIILYIYIKEVSKEKKYRGQYDITITLKNKDTIKTKAFLDTGCTLKDPYLNRPIIILKRLKEIEEENYILVPFNTIIKKSLIKCYEIDHIEIEGKVKKKILIGISPSPNLMNDKECIIGKNILEG